MNARPMSMEHARALAMACDLHSLLAEINEKPGHGAGPRVERAWDRMDDAIELLDDDEALHFLKLSERPASRLSTLVLSHRYRWAPPSQKPVALPER
jgi:hypothetical protein